MPATSSTANASTAPAPTTTTTPPPSTPEATGTSTTPAAPNQGGGLPRAGQIAIGIIVPAAVILLVGALWFLIFRRPSRGQGRGGHRRWGTGTNSSFGGGGGDGTGSRAPTPPPAYSKSGLDAVVTPSTLSMHERFIMEANAARAQVGASGEQQQRAGEEGRGMRWGIWALQG
ncbi:4f1425b6-69e5-4993-a86f-a4f5d7dfe7ac [Thermothielavioides terrestris]|uniref:4f1425b6-69e5-4993-a86f-a4f5d7dfe7ac n=1 Tax=Thermothielavioides terrestris TaxID=2587410 RepID=A0A3S4C7L1_9PEZI|nr:4f1425b6-69e5-4993-a86f-a4f5d7dfe7ac [Thermothielavioides terrestris]